MVERREVMKTSGKRQKVRRKEKEQTGSYINERILIRRVLR